jgi:hypothetical protein
LYDTCARLVVKFEAVSEQLAVVGLLEEGEPVAGGFRLAVLSAEVLIVDHPARDLKAFLAFSLGQIL